MLGWCIDEPIRSWRYEVPFRQDADDEEEQQDLRFGERGNIGANESVKLDQAGRDYAR